MSPKKTTIHPARAFLLAATAAVALFVAASPALSHGGKEHGDAGFTALMALEKAIDFYNRLLSSGKLDTGWEAGLENVGIAAPSHQGRNEFMVSFRRNQGDPRTVYFFFTAEGKYAGSNFTGP